MTRPIFPRVERRRAKYGARLKTNVRKKYRGKYYLWLVVQTIQGDDDAQYDFMLDRFYADVYNTIVFGKVTRWLIDNELVVLDPIQCSEERRMRILNI